jgi:threonine dehydratase
MRLMWEILKIVVEPSSAVPLTAIVERRIDIAGRRAAIIVTGGNADLSNLIPLNSRTSLPEGITHDQGSTDQRS